MKIESIAQLLKIAKMFYGPDDMPEFDETELVVIAQVFIGQDIQKVIKGFMVAIALGDTSFPNLVDVIEGGGMHYETK